MSTNPDSADYTEQELRDRFPEVVQGRAEKAKVLHLPDPHAESPEPMCDRHTSNGWRSVSIKSFPPGHRSFCSYCIHRLDEQAEVGVRNVDTPGWVRSGTVVAGNAMEADW